MTSNTISREDIDKLAVLARIQISDSEKESMRGDIESILAYVGQVQNVQLEVGKDIPPLRNVMRDDVVTHTSGEFTEDLLNLAPAREGQYLKVKKILG
jgi:aspartyl-tRNA(Asn)/glutamyl-tRNA(Gln) amidotransferase subunit C